MNWNRVRNKYPVWTYKTHPRCTPIHGKLFAIQGNISYIYREQVKIGNHAVGVSTIFITLKTVSVLFHSLYVPWESMPVVSEMCLGKARNANCT